MMKLRLTQAEKSWVLYDVGNSAFVLIVVTTIMPIFFKDIASKGIESAVSTSNWGFANAAASLSLGFLAPILGAIADVSCLKKKLLIAFAGAGIGFTLIMTAVGQGDWLMCLLIFIFARIGFSGANLFYDAFIVDITESDRIDWVSACGYAWGYIGGAVPFVMVIFLMITATDRDPSGSIPLLQSKLAFVIAAIWWLLFSIPIVKNVRQRCTTEAGGRIIRQGFSRLYKTFIDIRQYRNAFIFLVAYFFYIDGVDTIITMAAVYGREIGLSVTVLILAVLMIQIVAFPFALAYGKMAETLSARVMLYIGILVYSVITLIGYFLPAIHSMQAKVIVFWILSFLVATSMGGIQALSRSYFSRLIPSSRSAEFFGFYNIFGKFSAVIGPFLMGFIGRLTGDSRYGVLSIFILFLLGGLLLRQVKEPLSGGLTS